MAWADAIRETPVSRGRARADREASLTAASGFLLPITRRMVAVGRWQGLCGHPRVAPAHGCQCKAAAGMTPNVHEIQHPRHPFDWDTTLG